MKRWMPLPVRRAAWRLRALLHRWRPPPPQPHVAVLASHAVWLARLDTPDEAALARLAASAGTIPPVLVIARFSAASVHLVADTIDRLCHSVGVRWTARIVFTPDCDAAAIAGARSHIADPRIDFGDAALAAAELVVALDGGALPRPHALRLLAEALLHHPDAGMAYADEDRLGPDGVPADPWFKPRFSPLLTQQGHLLGRLLALRPRPEDWPLLTAPRADADAALRRWALTLGESGVVHVPHILFSDALPPAPGLPEIPPPLPDQLPRASILIPTRDGWDLLQRCLHSLEQTDWPADRLEILVIDNGSTDATTLHGLAEAERAGRVRVLRDDLPFNYSRLNNMAARAATGALLVLLNNDTEILHPAWLRRLAAYALHPGAGAVGVKLLYPDRTVQHGGVVLGLHGAAGHAFVGLGKDEAGPHGLANLTREVLAVTGACLAITRAAFEAVGGLDEAYRVSFNDVALCLDLHSQGRRNVIVAAPMVLHHESRTRGADDTPAKVALARAEAAMLAARHPQLLRDDPTYSPNLSFETAYAPAFAPRRRRAWNTASTRRGVLVLAAWHAPGNRVAMVVAQQARALLARGFDVTIAGPRHGADQPYPGCRRLEVDDPRAAAALASELGVDLAIVHSVNFFGMARWVGAWPPILGIDHGEPPPALFLDAPHQQNLLDEKAMALPFCRRVLAISDSVAAESRTPIDAVIAPGNDHFPRWDDDARQMRARCRRRHQWGNRFVVLATCNVDPAACRRHEIDAVMAVRRALQVQHPALAARTVFVLCGQGPQADARTLTKAGFVVKWGARPADFAAFHAAADAYLRLSRWDGHDFGVDQALAIGLPVIASDIAAHRNLGVTLADDPLAVASMLADVAASPTERVPRVHDWAPGLARFADDVERLCGAALLR